jgi:hypothetical protein
VIEKLLVKLSCIKEPSALRNALFNSAAAVGILAEKLLNRSGLEDAVTWAFVLWETISIMQSINTLEMVFMAWNFDFQLYRTIY